MSDIYPLTFTPILKDKIWGGDKLKTLLGKKKASDTCGESWEISGVPGNLSIVSAGFLKGNNLEELIEVYMGDLVGDHVYDRYGLRFPLLIKFIDAHDLLSIQVHPDDEMAGERHGSPGKTEMWYILEREEKAEIISGFKKATNKETYLFHLTQKTLKDILNFEQVGKGDVFFIPAGRVHSIGTGILLAEIQQTSDVTYRIYDWDRIDENGNARDLHTELALDAIDYGAAGSSRIRYPNSRNSSNKVVDCPYFTTHYIPFDSPVYKDFHLIDSFVIYLCINGETTLQYAEKKSIKLHKGETVLVPAMIKNIILMPQPFAELLEVYINT